MKTPRLVLTCEEKGRAWLVYGNGRLTPFIVDHCKIEQNGPSIVWGFFVYRVTASGDPDRLEKHFGCRQYALNHIKEIMKDHFRKFGGYPFAEATAPDEAQTEGVVK